MPSSDKPRPVGASGKKKEKKEKKKGPVASDYMDEKEVIGRTVAGLKGIHGADRETALRMGVNPNTMRMDSRGDIMGLGARAREDAVNRLLAAQRIRDVKSAARGVRGAVRAESLMRNNRSRALGG